MRWELEDVGPQPTETKEAVQKAFTAAGCSASLDVIHLYGEIGGMDIGDNQIWRLWPLSEVAAQEPTNKGALFADYMLSCWAYRLKPMSAEKNAVYVDYFDGKEPTLVASSLEEFFDRYVKNAAQLLDPNSPTAHSNGV